MNCLKKLKFTLLMFVLIVSNSLAIDKTEVSTFLSNSLSNLKSVSFDFVDMNNSKIAGSIKATKGNKYKIVKSGRTIICNSEKIWNYTEKDNKVLVSEFDEVRAGLSIENMFFNIMKNAKLSQFKKENSTKMTKGLYVCVLDVNDNISKKNKIDQIKLWINSKKEIKYIGSIYKGESDLWQVNNLKLNPKLADNIFKFVAPKGCKIIDLD